MGFLHGTRIFKANSYVHVNTHIIFFLIFLLIQKFVNRAFFVHSGNTPSHDVHDHILNNIVSKTLDPILGPRQNERLKILFCFPENAHIIPFFKKSYAILLFSKQITLLNDACHSDHHHSLFSFLCHFIYTRCIHGKK